MHLETAPKDLLVLALGLLGAVITEPVEWAWGLTAH